MLYSLIPPVLIVLSVIGIIIMLVKKAPNVAAIASQKDLLERPDSVNGRENFLSRYKAKNDEKNTGVFKHKSLIVLEKSTRRMKIIFLRLENTFSLWSENLRKKRRLMSEVKPEISDSSINDDTFHKIENYPSDDRAQKDETSASVRDMAPQRRSVRPMISDEVITPKITPEKKDRLEKILIERIAGNPKDVEAYERLGEYYFEIRNFEHSKECFKQVMKLDPANANVRSKMRKLERLLYK